MNRIIDPRTNPGELLDAMLEGWVVAEISDAMLARKQPEPLTESRRGPGIQSVRPSRVAVSERFRTAR
jgi:hypothetical protein